MVCARAPSRRGGKNASSSEVGYQMELQIWFPLTEMDIVGYDHMKFMLFLY